MTHEIQDKEHQEVEKEERLFSEFPVPTYEEWRQAAEKTLKGAPFEEKLVTKTYEGISLQPMYRKEDIEGLSHVPSLPGVAPYVRGTRSLGYQEKRWEVCQELVYGTPEEVNEAARYDLKRGQTMLNLVLDTASALGQDPDQAAPEDVEDGGVSISSVQDLVKAFEGINLEQTPLLIQAGAVGLPMYSMLIAYAGQHGIAPTRLRGCVGMDPLGTLAKKGTLPFSLQKAYDFMASYTLWANDHTPELQTIFVQGNPYHNAGGNAVQELAFALATGVEYVRELQQRGLSIEEIATKMLFSFSIGSNFFMEIAKLRAGRLLWARIIEAFGGKKDAQKMFIHARTSAWTKTVYDPYVNMLRGTAEAFAAIIGGIDSLHVSSFDEVVRPGDEFSRRIARNTQIILEKEAHLSKVVDPAGGSWYVESLTDSLIKQAWELFQQIEGHGGMFKFLENGVAQERIAEIAKKRAENIGRRKDKFVGTNMYPNLSEAKLSKPEADAETVHKKRSAKVSLYRLAGVQIEKDSWLSALRKNKTEIIDYIEAFHSGVTLGEWVQAVRSSDEAIPKIQALTLYRGAELFEVLRENAEKYKVQNGSLPKVFLANMGPILQYKLRADFTTGFFEVGGFEVVSNQGFDNVEQAAQAAFASGASIVVICSTDEVYSKLVPSIARLLKQANPDITLFIAGQPITDQVESFKQAGVDEYIHMRANCHDVLFNLQQKKGIGR
jgi:methylmalonyl-CoA mutase